MVHFDADYLKFLRELPANNNRDWFNENKSRFKTHVEGPFHDFVNELIKKVSPLMEGLEEIDSKHCVFRIYRDVRFSKDKSPYKSHMSALITPSGRKGMSDPGLYLESSGEHLRLYSGAYQLDKEALERVRTAIMKNEKQFAKLITNKKFVDTFGEIRGEKNKRIPKEFREAADHQPLLFNKNFYFFREWPAEKILEANLIKDLLSTYKVAQPVNEFLFSAIK